FLKVTVVLCTATTSFLTYHSAYVLNNIKKERASQVTIDAQKKLIRNLQFQMNIITFGTMFPTCYWLVALFFGVVLPEVTVGMHLFVPLAILANSTYAIISSQALSCKTLLRRRGDYTKTPTIIRTRIDNSSA
ncbi:hypothetical protein PENTCL1PPCAC_16092, partial [Pristionchus entomophagus]